MNCLIKNIPPNIIPAQGNDGSAFPFAVTELECMLAPDFYLIREESVSGNESYLFTQHPRFIEVFEEDIA